MLFQQVIRVSGDTATDAIKLTQQKKYSGTDINNVEKYKLKQRYAYFKKFYNIFHDNPSQNQIDEGILLYFKAPHSFTGEDMLEFQVHGGNAVKQQMLMALSRFPTFRQAEPGEFTKRAYFNGKLDLVKAEGINDLINAESEQQLKLSMQQLQGRHSKLYNDLRTRLMRMLAHAEAYIDFEADETNDLKPEVFVELGKETEILSNQIKGYIKDSEIGEVIREGFKISIIGPPNAGKSTLMNLLAKRRVSIVSEIAGTTRDLISTNINLFGYNVILVDTAGLREQTRDNIEQQGIQLAQKEAKSSHGVLIVLDIQDLEKVDDGSYIMKEDQQLIVNEITQSQDPIIVINKIDLYSDSNCQPSNTQDYCKLVLKNGLSYKALNVSFKDQLNLEKLYEKLEQFVKNKISTSQFDINNLNADDFLISRQRHRELLEQTLQHLENFRRDDLFPDMLVEELRAAVICIGRITGHIDVEDILDILFKEFCIGK
ncbi:trna modification gtpase [Stylonychia lemnae]|uniref:Trna modification gtpase n=1 Tax=Stylonychia lemnae TaxID=5949 RepID=A0A077ZV53_STYLE|nr:trna modification gtpase [Stylonychia lemnae]|eukprot:CDW73775.1 trna modification gtpase [Stylonychia lemnae]